MLQITVTANTSEVVIQDPFPSDGAWTLSVGPGLTKSDVISWDQFQRISTQIHLLETSGFCTVTLDAISNGEVRGQENDLIGLPAIDRVAKFTLAVTGETDLEIEGDQLIAQQGIAEATLGDTTTPNALLTFYSPTPGVAGNNLTVEIVDSGVPGALTVAVVGTDVTIDQNDSASDATTVAALVNTAIGGARGTVFAVAEGTGAGVVLPVAQTSLTGGWGDGLYVNLCGQPCTVIQTTPGALPTDPQQVIVDTPDLTGIAAATEAVVLSLRSGNKKTTTTVTLV